MELEKIGTILFIVIAIIGLFGTYLVDRYKCGAKAGMIEAEEMSYGLTTGCMVKISGKFIPYEKYIHSPK